MARPKLKEDIKKERISITLPPMYKQVVVERGNASVFVEDTIRLYLQLEGVAKRLSKSKKPTKDLIEEMEDLVDSMTINLRRPEPQVAAEGAFKALWKKRK